MLDFLLTKSADLLITVKGLVWGRGYEWETLIPAVNPISYAMDFSHKCIEMKLPSLTL